MREASFKRNIASHQFTEVSMIRALLTTPAAAILAIAPIAAHAEVRTAAHVDASEQIAANPWIPWLVALAAALAIILVISDDNPSSP
ncbi:MAG: hypothetical protein ABIP24_04410 [Croceibacterium sp.]